MTTPVTSAGIPRLASLDIIRGVALCGILVVNLPSHLGIARWTEDDVPINPVSAVLDALVQQRFFPIFSLLFGIGFGLMWQSAQVAPRPRLVMLRRLLFLLALGLLHQMVHQGEVLAPYALAGLVLALPLTWASRTAALGLGATLIAAAVPLVETHLLIGGLITLGFGIAQYDIARRAEEGPRVGWIALAIGAPLGIALTAFTMTGSASVLGAIASQPSGWLMGLAYIGVILLLAQTGARRWLSAVFAPLGRMALTMYLMATAFFLAVRPLAEPLGFDATSAGYLRMLAVCAIVLAVQILLARWWLARWEQGPMEALWRRVTWWGDRPSRGAVSGKAVGSSARARRTRGLPSTV